MATAPAPPAALDLNKIATAYVNLRNAKHEKQRAHDAEIDEMDRKLDLLANTVLGHMNAHGIQNIATPAGTFYRQEKVKPSISDDKVFYDWVQAANAAGDALERRVKVGFVKDFMEANQGLPPPGIAVSREYEVRVRKGS
jgi:hypothetical protein